MSIKLRFALLLGMLLLIFLGCLASLRLLEQKQLAEALVASQRDATVMLERWLELHGSSLRQFAEDYSRWDELVAFVHRPDPAWAETNLRESLASFNIDDLWVLGTDGAPLYQVHQYKQSAPPLDAENWLQLVADTRFPHFFVPHPQGVLEIRGAPVQSSSDARRTSVPQGWLVVSRLWDDAHLEALGNLAESTLRLDPPSLSSVAAEPAAEPAAGPQFTLLRPLNDWRGETVRILQVTRDIPAIAQRLQTDAFEARVFILFGLLVMGALALSLHRWVLHPLNMIGESLAHRDAALLAPVIAQKTELSRIASRIEISFAQQQELKREVEERARLGRDLHDGVIQSIYAAGMGLAAARTLVATDPAEASRRVDQIRASLNETIRDVRNFITGLEPEALHTRTFTSAVAGLFELFEVSGPIEHRLDIDESAANRLHLAARTGALQIIRECASNAVRHGKARLIEISLRASPDKQSAHLVIVDHGSGFDLATSRRGRGLDNIVERARALGATAEITSEPGKGTRTSVRFPLSDSAS